MPRQHVNIHIALIGCVCLCLLGYLSWFESRAQEAAAQVAAGPDFDSPDSTSVIVNKHRPLADPAYVPQDLADIGGVQLRAEAAAAYLQMNADAAAAGVGLVAVSGFRTADAQTQLHSSYSNTYGQQAAESISARPGYSEHQTGLAVDIGNPDGACSLEPCFEATPAGAWAAANAHRYGFIIRYPAGAEATTGFGYEPWHLRYVGPELAATLTGSAQTLEQYAGLPAAPGYPADRAR
ncbi:MULTISPECIES: M15 family metallopeptidase [Arthrobacter]|uniref:M15 family metallopeptidase n=1 Tax=Arthrobacter caoxuetaonis TaxID=2886935 RepID=A0A9X1MFL3_9MICC|nr:MULTISPECIES: M15 family metallopeptidase [Arthrobacter]MCC3282616.1 M15 family metallopeptidase [Arthrobacter caoxuetaonis]MCC3297754.1 M15 family metallopeptidase [Arthrobacter caoxuetaonis]MCC9193704.1 M15 family metallopeptidase [Arthrobacter sp. zg-Y916]USQ56051.1 M15 family metallopeptidase [Arthrobacter caoxuetaonis]